MPLSKNKTKAENTVPQLQKRDKKISIPKSVEDDVKSDQKSAKEENIMELDDDSFPPINKESEGKKFPKKISVSVSQKKAKAGNTVPKQQKQDAKIAEKDDQKATKDGETGQKESVEVLDIASDSEDSCVEEIIPMICEKEVKTAPLKRKASTDHKEATPSKVSASEKKTTPTKKRKLPSFETSKLCFSGHSKETTEEDIQSHFGQFGVIVETSFKTHQRDVYQFSGFVLYYTSDMAKQAFLEESHKLHKEEMRVWLVPDEEEKKEEDSETPKSVEIKVPAAKSLKGIQTIHFSGFKKVTTETNVRIHFEQFGTVEKITFRTFDKDVYQFSGTIQFSSDDMAKKAVETQPHKINGENLKVWVVTESLELKAADAMKNLRERCILFNVARKKFIHDFDRHLSKEHSIGLSNFFVNSSKRASGDFYGYMMFTSLEERKEVLNCDHNAKNCIELFPVTMYSKDKFLKLLENEKTARMTKVGGSKTAVPEKDITCFVCDMSTHETKGCNQMKQENLSKIWKKLQKTVCLLCFTKGHDGKDCLSITELDCSYCKNPAKPHNVLLCWNYYKGSTSKTDSRRRKAPVETSQKDATPSKKSVAEAGKEKKEDPSKSKTCQICLETCHYTAKCPQLAINLPECWKKLTERNRCLICFGESHTSAECRFVEKYLCVYCNNPERPHSTVLCRRHYNLPSSLAGSKTKLPCVICDQPNHKTAKCPQLSKSVDHCWEMLRQKGACLLCFGLNHSTDVCQFQKNQCRHCGDVAFLHSTLICNQNYSQNWAENYPENWEENYPDNWEQNYPDNWEQNYPDNWHQNYPEPRFEPPVQQSSLNEPYFCILCDIIGHKADDCPELNGYSLKSAWSKLQTMQVCLLCFDAGHKPDRCGSGRKCGHCGKPHHTVLCFGHYQSEEFRQKKIAELAKKEKASKAVKNVASSKQKENVSREQTGCLICQKSDHKSSKCPQLAISTSECRRKLEKRKACLYCFELGHPTDGCGYKKDNACRYCKYAINPHSTLLCPRHYRKEETKPREKPDVSRSQGACLICLKSDHKTIYCPELPTSTSECQQKLEKRRACLYCFALGHSTDGCIFKTKNGCKYCRNPRTPHSFRLCPRHYEKEDRKPKSSRNPKEPEKSYLKAEQPSVTVPDPYLTWIPGGSSSLKRPNPESGTSSRKPDPHLRQPDSYQQQSDRYQKQSDPYQKQPDPYQKRSDQYHQRPDPYQQRSDPYEQRSDPYQQRSDPYEQRSDPYQKRSDQYQQRPDPHEEKANLYQRRETQETRQPEGSSSLSLTKDVSRAVDFVHRLMSTRKYTTSTFERNLPGNSSKPAMSGAPDDDDPMEETLRNRDLRRRSGLQSELEDQTSSRDYGEISSQSRKSWDRPSSSSVTEHESRRSERDDWLESRDANPYTRSSEWDYASRAAESSSPKLRDESRDFAPYGRRSASDSLADRCGGSFQGNLMEELVIRMSDKIDEREPGARRREDLEFSQASSARSYSRDFAYDTEREYSREYADNYRYGGVSRTDEAPEQIIDSEASQLAEDLLSALLQ